MRGMFESIYGSKVELWDGIPAQGKRAGELWSTIRFIPPNCEGISSTQRSDAEKKNCSRLSDLFSEGHLEMRRPAIYCGRSRNWWAESLFWTCQRLGIRR